MRGIAQGQNRGFFSQIRLIMLTPEIVQQLRDHFPALRKQVVGRPAVFFDGAAGTQVPQSVIDAISNYYIHCNANHEGVFTTSIESDALLHECHQAAADFVGVSDIDAVSFGANMTTLTFALSRALSKTWKPGDEIVLSRLEHDANFTPWTLAAQDAGVTIRYAEIDVSDCTLSVDQYRDLINERTRLVAVGCASNAVGTVNPVKEICTLARDAGALSFLDCVHYAPHDLIDVKDWGCDLLICSAYKFFGPHIGIMYGRREVLESVLPYKLRTSPIGLPGRWMTGTQNHACIAGVKAAIDYVADIGRKIDPTLNARRDALKCAFGVIRAYERTLLDQMLDGLMSIQPLKVYGITEPSDRDSRFPTIAIRHPEIPSKEFATRLAADGIFTWDGNYYALPLTETLGVEPEGMVRISAVHYNTPEEIDRMLESTRRICST